MTLSSEKTSASIPSAPATAQTARPGMGVRRFGSVNRLGLLTLIQRETYRFLKVYSQTLVAPVITAAMFLAVFTLALGEGREPIHGAPFVAFLAPGIVMMTVIQNAFANTSSSLIIAKVQGSIVDTVTPPLSPAELTLGLVAGGVLRGVLVAVLCGALLFPVAGTGLAAPLWAAFFAVSGALMLSLLGVAAGIWADKFDHMAAVTNFIVTPLSFLSGTFYSIERLPDGVVWMTQFNPIFYLIDGFRYGALGVSDASPWVGAAVCCAMNLALWGLCWRFFATGYKIKA